MTGPRRTPSVMGMRTTGIAVLGLFVGLLTGLVLWEIVGVAMLGIGGGSLDLPGPVVVMLRAVTPLFGVIGAIVAVALDRRNRTKTKP